MTGACCGTRPSGARPTACPTGDFGASRINSGIAACVLPNQLTALVAARGLDGFWCARTENGGQTWTEMSGMGVGTFLSGPALACRRANRSGLSRRHGRG